MRLILLLPAVLLACEPPPALTLDDSGSTGAPEVRIIWPLANTEVPLADDCVLRTEVAWDIDNFELVPVNDADGNPNVNADGEGHVHVLWAPPAYAATHDQYTQLEQPGLAVGASLTVTVELHENEHAFLGISDELEILVGQDPAGACP
jgi:hypothetical protein